ncbi:MAG: alpha/beta hydrolase, partial [Lentisphaerae bacterium]|nr:alpha/beta hydrolase [Lentisphaerota bacterium]
MIPATYTYKCVNDLAVKADVYRSEHGGKRPCVVWIHGGALINGHRGAVPAFLLEPLLEAGYVVVSVDYRLAPETMLPQIIEDLEDAWRWVCEEGPGLFGIDGGRVAAVGGSAGGYLALTAGFRACPRPACVVAFWGYGDLIGSWYSMPSPHPAHHRLEPTEVEARQQVSGSAVSDARERQGDGGAFYQYCRQQGIWPQEVSGWDPHAEAERFYPFMPVRNVSPGYPPALLVHGTDDTDVPYEQSVMMTEQF